MWAAPRPGRARPPAEGADGLPARWRGVPFRRGRRVPGFDRDIPRGNLFGSIGAGSAPYGRLSGLLG
ncbi:hypothetical protein GCM10010393_39860 [Streptomyces gobitricini]|uniref:Uncharacterized protein n=1 Tax=Streptomyces gobitricini TaxID=68211 RepID=A0ABN3MKQ4_9ACTN